MQASDQTLRPGRWFWLYLPLVLYAGHYVARVLLPDPAWDRFVLHEFGFTEQATVLALALALGLGVLVVRHMLRLGRPVLAAFFAVFCMGCLYFGGEEASWGQHWFGLQTPETWAPINLREEINLHNLEGTRGWLFNKLPRAILSLAIVVGGLVLPLVQRSRGHAWQPDSLADWVMPGMTCVPAAAVVALSTLPQKLGVWVTGGRMPWWLDIAEGEVKELMMGVFLLVYIAAVWVRARRRVSPAPAGGGAGRS